MEGIVEIVERYDYPQTVALVSYHYKDQGRIHRLCWRGEGGSARMEPTVVPKRFWRVGR